MPRKEAGGGLAEFALDLGGYHIGAVRQKRDAAGYIAFGNDGSGDNDLVGVVFRHMQGVIRAGVLVDVALLHEGFQIVRDGLFKDILFGTSRGSDDRITVADGT